MLKFLCPILLLCLNNIAFAMVLPELDEFSQNNIIAISIKDLQNDKYVFQFNNQIPLPPASTMKLVTAAAAADYFTDNKTIATKLSAFGSVRNGTLHGNIVLLFDQDPNFKRETLVTWFQDIAKKLHIHTIDGTIYIIDQKHPLPGVFQEESPDCYASSPHDAIINKNCITIKIKPTQNGKNADITLLNTAKNSLFTNNIITKDECTSDGNTSVHTSWSDSTSEIITLPGSPMELSGCISTNHYPIMIKTSPEHQSFISHQIRRSMKDAHIEHIGNFSWRDSLISQHTKKPLYEATHHSKPILSLLPKMLEISNNHFAHTLFNHITPHERWSQQENDIKALISKHNINFDNASITEGSGLSRYNLITTDQLVELLSVIHKNPRLHKLVELQLPINGQSGTLKDRLKNLGHNTQLQAKTGTLKNVKSLAGFLTVDKNVYAIAIIASGDKTTPDAFLEIEDALFGSIVKTLTF
ncbi:MAG: D-alanyl-D-alanine carboxypeptidase/D-alanyl-D-alanine endopeptidase [Candidatus Comchoanobacterales bacterium]